MTCVDTSRGVQRRLRSRMIPEEYGFSFPSDRNDISKFNRLGDGNKKRAQSAMRFLCDWLELLGRRVIRLQVWVDIPWALPGLLGWYRSGPEAASQLSGIASTSAAEATERAERAPSETLRLAREAAARQAHRTRKDMLAWIDRLVQDVQDAND